MTAGITTYNTQGNLTIDENFIGHGYLSKHKLPDGSDGMRLYDVTFSCVGFPLIFFSIPHNVTDGTGQNGWSTNVLKVGVALVRLIDNGSNSWTARVLIQNPNTYYTADNLYLRVFGRVSDNWPSGVPGATSGIQIFKSDGVCVFDSNIRMLRLAGNTYDAELTLTGDVPGLNDNNDIYDTYVTMPFDMANKSIAATTRGTIFYPYNYDSYVDGDTGQEINRYTFVNFNTLYASINNTLRIKRCGELGDSFEQAGTFIILDQDVPVYSRLAVIDNSMYP